MKISDQNKMQILRLIAQGECLDIRNLEDFDRWVDHSYEELEFHPRHKQRFDEYCRSSSASSFTRICQGVQVLRAALEQDV